MEQQIFNEEGFQIAGFGELPVIPVDTQWLSKTLQDNMDAVQIYDAVCNVSERLNEVYHTFGASVPKKDNVLSEAQRTASINTLFHLARHEYDMAIKEFATCVENSETGKISYNDGILYSILADAFANTMAYRNYQRNAEQENTDSTS